MSILVSRFLIIHFLNINKLKDLKTVLETLNSETVCLPDSVLKIMLYESGLLPLTAYSGTTMEKHEVHFRVAALGKQLVDASKDDAVVRDMFTMEEYRDVLLRELELINFVMEYRARFYNDEPKIVGKVNLNDDI